MSALQTIGQRQKALLEALLFSHDGMTVDELAETLAISRNAVTQHLSTLEGFGYIENAVQASTGGRPSKRYGLTVGGKELFPRHYALFAKLLVRLLNDRVGEEVLSSYMKDLGEALAMEHRGPIDRAFSLEQRVVALADIMQQLGYEARAEFKPNQAPEIVANNCVFHQLATECKVVCELDRALITTALGGETIKHSECIVEGGSVCRFSIAGNEPANT